MERRGKWVRFVLLWTIATVSARILFELLLAVGFKSPGPFGTYHSFDYAVLAILPTLRWLWEKVVEAIRGLLFGTFQWFVLRPYLTRAHRWIFAAAIGELIARLVFSSILGDWYFELVVIDWLSLMELSPIVLQFAGTAALRLTIWIAVGIGQWWAVRGKVRDAWLWAVLIPVIECLALALYWFVSMLLGLIALGVVTGLLMAFLLSRTPITEQPDTIDPGAI